MRSRLIALCAVLALPLLASATPASYAAGSSSSDIGIIYAIGDVDSDRVFMSGNVASGNPKCRKNRTIKLITIADDNRTLAGKDTSGATNHWGLAVPPDLDFELVLTRKKLSNGHVCLGTSVKPLIKLVFVARPLFPETGNTILAVYKAATINTDRFVVGAVDSSKGRCIEGRTVQFQAWINDAWKVVGTDKTAGTGDTFAIRAPANSLERLVVLPRTVGSVKCDKYVYSPGI